MKTICTPAVKRFFALLGFIFTQSTVWAIDTPTATTIKTSESIFCQPWLWIAVAVIITIKLLGPFKRDSGEFSVIRKKDVNKNPS